MTTYTRLDPSSLAVELDGRIAQLEQEHFRASVLRAEALADPHGTPNGETTVEAAAATRQLESVEARLDVVYELRSAYPSATAPALPPSPPDLEK